MKAWTKRGIVAATVVAAATAITVGLPSTSAAVAPRLGAIAISSDGTLMASFWTDRPATLNWFQAVQGLSGDTKLIGIDYRVQDNKLYGVGNAGGVYVIPPVDPVVATKVSQLTVPLYGTTFGVDFNPAADRLRVLSDWGQNLRHNLNNHTTIADQSLSTPPTEGTTTGVTAAAYTNNDLDPTTATTLFDIGTATDQVLIQSPANSGQLAATGSIGLDAGLNAGFDIYSDLTNGKTTSLVGFAIFTPPSGSPATLYTVDLLTGSTALAGATQALSQFPLAFTDIAVVLDAS
jgi:Domain of unknown function (DUF4394)